MSEKNKVVEINDVSEMITDILNKSDNVYITTGKEEFKILLDDDAINLLKAHYKTKSLWGSRVNG